MYRSLPMAAPASPCPGPHGTAPLTLHEQFPVTGLPGHGSAAGICQRLLEISRWETRGRRHKGGIPARSERARRAPGSPPPARPRDHALCPPTAALCWRHLRYDTRPRPLSRGPSHRARPAQPSGATAQRARRGPPPSQHGRPRPLPRRCQARAAGGERRGGGGL